MVELTAAAADWSCWSLGYLRCWGAVADWTVDAGVDPIHSGDRWEKSWGWAVMGLTEADQVCLHWAGGHQGGLESLPLVVKAQS